MFVLSLVCGLIPIIFGVIFVFMPESPYYWVSKNQTEKAVSSLKWLRGNDYDYSSELQELQSEHQERENSKISFAAAFGRKTSVKALIIMLGLMFFQQMSGINAVIFYTGFIFEKANTGIKGSLATIIVGVMQVIATFVSSMIVDKLGRRILLLLSVSVMALCTIVLGVYFFLSDSGQPGMENLGWLPIVAMCVFIVCFSLGFGPIPWVSLEFLVIARSFNFKQKFYVIFSLWSVKYSQLMLRVSPDRFVVHSIGSLHSSLQKLSLIFELLSVLDRHSGCFPPFQLLEHFLYSLLYRKRKANHCRIFRKC